MPLFPITTRLLQGMIYGKNIVLLLRRKAGMSVSGME